MHKAISILSFICLLTVQAKAQNIIQYNLEARMDLYSTLWTGDSLLYWGFKDLGEDPGVRQNHPGPTVMCNEGDSVILIMTNPSFEAHTIHLHGLDVDQVNDGVPMTSFFIQPNNVGTYSFRADYAGNFLYHCHVGTVLHLQMGMYGAVIVKAANGVKEVYTGGPSYDREFTWLGHEVDKSWHDDYTQIGGFMNFFPDHFQVNGKSQQQIYLDSSTSIYDGRIGETILLRLLNIGYGVNKYIFPANLNPEIITSDGRPLASTVFKDTILVYPGERFSVLIRPQALMTDSITLEYRSLYQNQFWGKELIPIKVDGYLGIEKENIKTSTFYPNPVENQIIVSNDDFSTVEIYTLYGALLKRVNITSDQKVNVSELSAGTYILKAETTEGKTVSEVLIKK